METYIFFNDKQFDYERQKNMTDKKSWLRYWVNIVAQS